MHVNQATNPERTSKDFPTDERILWHEIYCFEKK